MELDWDQTDKKFYHVGSEKPVLYVKQSDGTYGAGVAWEGVTAVNQAPSGGTPESLYANNVPYVTLTATEVFNGTIEAMTYPDEFEVCDGTQEITNGMMVRQQARSKFALCWRTEIGRDGVGDRHAYMLHIVYGCTASPVSRDSVTINEDTSEPISFSWEMKGTPVTFTANGMSYVSSKVEIDSRSATPANLANLEAILYGVDDPDTAPRLPLPDELYTILSAV